MASRAASREQGTQMDSELFRVALGRRIRLPLLENPATCPMCGTALDIYMDHALVCSCGGDRTIRHNAVRNTTYSACREAGTNAELEKAGLLPPRPADEEVTSARRSEQRGRRPADIWLPRGIDGLGAAVDFAVTSGLRSDRLVTAAADPTCVLASYEDYKRSYLNTERQCNEQGFHFMPFIMEAHGGGFALGARRLISFIAKVAAARNSEDVEIESAGLMRRISISIHRENARSILRRLWPVSTATPVVDPGVWSSPQWQ